MGRKVRPDGYWDNISNVKRELDIVIREIKHFPKKGDLIERNQNYLYDAICKYGGLHKFAKRFGYDTLTTPKDYWKKWKNVKSSLEVIIDILEKFPTDYNLRDFGYNGLQDAIRKWHGGMVAVKQKLGYSKSVSISHWKDIKVVKKTLRDLKKCLGHFPSTTEIIQSGNRNLPKALMKYHGGLRAVAKSMGIELITKPKNYWNKENTYIEAKTIYKEYNSIPSSNFLRLKGYSQFLSAVSEHYHGLGNLRIALDSEFESEESKKLESLLEKYTLGDRK